MHQQAIPGHERPPEPAATVRTGEGTRVRVRAASRLHFGLMALGAGPRPFSGVGLMIEDPGIELVASLSGEIEVEGDVPPALRRHVANLIHRSLAESPGIGGVHIELERVAAHHAGLGTGTQLSLSIAAAVQQLLGQPMGVIEMAQRMDRGRRSGIGVHGFEQGGFLIDSGKPATDAATRAVLRREFPTDWPVLLIRPDLPHGLSGDAEEAAFRTGLSIPPATTDRLARLVLLGMMAGLEARDYQTFAEAVGEYNLLVGECFRSVQGSAFADPSLADVVGRLKEWGVAAAGQSSWGPTLFAILPDPDWSGWAGQRLCAQFGLHEDRIILTTARNRGAHVRFD